MTENAKTCQNAYTSKWHRKQDQFFIHTFRSFQRIRFVKKQIIPVANKGEGWEGGNFRLCPLLGPRAI